jgi:hypothetical protein
VKDTWELPAIITSTDSEGVARQAEAVASAMRLGSEWLAILIPNHRDEKHFADQSLVKIRWVAGYIGALPPTVQGVLAFSTTGSHNFQRNFAFVFCPTSQFSEKAVEQLAVMCIRNNPGNKKIVGNPLDFRVHLLDYADQLGLPGNIPVSPTTAELSDNQQTLVHNAPILLYDSTRSETNGGKRGVGSCGTLIRYPCGALFAHCYGGNENIAFRVPVTFPKVPKKKIVLENGQEE